jgi:peroxiredoxin
MSQSAQSKATRKYEAKMGMISKTYKLKGDLAKAFKEACDREGTNQSKELSKFMEQYIAEHPAPDEDSDN